MFSILELQRELQHPKMPSKVSGLLRNGPQKTSSFQAFVDWVESTRPARYPAGKNQRSKQA